MQNAEMDKHDRLRQARIAAGFSSAAEAARRLGVSYGTYSGHENGSRGIKNRDLFRYAQSFNVPVDWLVFGHESNFMEKCVVVAFAEAGHIPDGQVEYFEEARSDEGIILPPFVPGNSGYINISGDYLRGIADPGWIIICESTFKDISDEHLDKLCLCRIEDGRMYIRKILESGTEGLYNLESPQHSVIRKVKVTGVSKIFIIATDIMMGILREAIPEVMKIASDINTDRVKLEDLQAQSDAALRETKNR